MGKIMKLKNLKKSFIAIAIATISTLGILSSGNASYATTDPNGGLKLGLEAFRSSGYSYKTGLNGSEKILWKIASYNQAGTVANKDRAIYCLKGGPGFGSSTSMGDGSVTQRNYTEYFNLKDLVNIPSPYKDVLPSGENYNSLVWVLEHSYVPAPSRNATTEQTELAAEYRKNLLLNAGIQNSKISDDEIDIAQQLAVWYFTNSDVYHIETTDLFSLWIKETTDSDYMPLGDKFRADGDQRNDDTITLFNYFVRMGKANAAKAPVVDDTAKFQLTANNVKTQTIGSNYLIGPYKINTLTKSDAKLVGNLLAADGVTSINYNYADAQGNILNKGLSEILGTEFYLLVPQTANITNAKFNVNVTEYTTQITYWSVAGSTVETLKIDQPVAEVVRNKEAYVLEAPIDYTPVFDLALRKFITKINNNVVDPSREPVVDISHMQDGSVTTAIKQHTKKPLYIKTGDTVLYTIRIYNEGNLNGYAKQITDYLPEGLVLKEGSTINAENGWTNPSGDGKTIVTDKLKDTLISKFDGTTLAYVDVQVECTVTATLGENDKTLKNVAEITKHSDETGNEAITDIDSTPNNLTPEQKENYNPGESEKGWGYEDDDDYENLVLLGKPFDLALRKFITNINGKELIDTTTGKYLREPTIDVAPLKNGTGTTALYRHPKDPVGVSVGDIVIYTIRVYNEGDIDGYASAITDYLPPQLEFVIDDDEHFNATYGWVIDSSLRKATTNHLAKTEIDPEDNLLKAFNKDTMITPDYRELKIKCRVKTTQNLDKVITNIAEVTDFTDKDGNTILDRDSSKANIHLPTDEDLPDYKGKDSNKSILNDKDYFYQGQEDDDDFEKLILEEFDLALRKFITGVNETPVTNRVPVFTNVKDENGNYIYEHTKEPVEVETTDIVEYTIRIYNEGDIAGYAKLVKDDIPSGLEFLPEDETNITYRWKMLKEDGTQTTNVAEAKSIVTDYLSKEQEKTAGENLIAAFDPETMESPDYRDVKVAFKVVAPNSYTEIITNIAEIADDADENGNPVEDKDSTPDNNKDKEDDIDKEHIKLSYFDLALRKFITAVDNTAITDRVPVFKIDEDGNYIYEHTKEPVVVENGNIVTYTLRIFNEGTKAGYASSIKDDLPEGLLFLPENEINQTYRWVMLDKDGNPTKKVEEAVAIQTDYLSKEQEDQTGRDNLLQPFDSQTMKQPDYRDIQIAFQVTEPNTSDRILINKAQIADDQDKNGNPVVDKDSTPDKWIEGEDDQDIEKVKVKYFDLALRKWVTQAIVIENGKETITETGHKAEDDPEAPVKVEIVQSKLNKVVVKFRYKIRVTNEGEIAGYVKEISDYIPEGLKFVPEDNPKWKQVDGKVVTDQLKDTLLQPGESAEVEILLTWINSADNLGLKVNTAEISKDYNDSHTPDIDSTPNNKVPGEDDIDDAPVILSIKTGVGDIKIEYIALTGGALILICVGAVLIKKFVL
ncbi:MAG: Cys-Gln thioester bond-forming surface protein [Clostridia bacterium]